MLKKQISKAFGKKIYLLGIDQEGKNVWLEEAKWDCDWYWGFGYLETYTNNKRPDLAKDINSHQHWDSSIIGAGKNKDKKYNDYAHHPNESTFFTETVLTDEESWELADLMKSFYILKKTSDFFHQGNSHVSSPELNLKDEKIYDKINKEILPQIFKEVYRILSPKE